MYTIECQLINKSYTFNKSRILALKNIDLRINEAEIFGLIGPDGAGKTSLIRILTTLILPDSGTAKVNDLDVLQDFELLRSKIGYMPGRFSLYQDLTVKENLEFFASVFGTTVKENYHLIKDIYQQIEAFENRKAGALSGGMKQKLALSCALIHSPTVLFLDEPTTGVDAVSRIEFWEMLKRLQSKGITIFVSTPYMDEASLCDRIALIQEGKIFSVASPVNITKNYLGNLWSVRSEHMYHLMSDLKSWEKISSVFSFGDALHTASTDVSLSDFEIRSFLESKGHQSVSVELINPTVEDCFMQLMKSN